MTLVQNIGEMESNANINNMTLTSKLSNMSIANERSMIDSSSSEKEK
jgi:hypothetical protein